MSASGTIFETKLKAIFAQMKASPDTFDDDYLAAELAKEVETFVLTAVIGTPVGTGSISFI